MHPRAIVVSDSSDATCIMKVERQPSDRGGARWAGSSASPIRMPKTALASLALRLAATALVMLVGHARADCFTARVSRLVIFAFL